MNPGLQQDIEAVLVKKLPEHLKREASNLAYIVSSIIQGDISQNNAQNQVESNVELQKAITALEGQTIKTKQAVVSFGDNSQQGDTSIRDIAGRDTFTIGSVTINTISENRPHETPSKERIRNTNSLLFLSIPLVLAASLLIYAIFQYNRVMILQAELDVMRATESSENSNINTIRFTGNTEQDLMAATTVATQSNSFAVLPQGSTIYTNTFTDVNLANVTTRRFIASAEFINPSNAETWNYGFSFLRTSSSSYRLAIQSNKTWNLEFFERDTSITINSGSIENLNTLANESNKITLVVLKSQALLIVNDEVVSAIDILSRSASGDVAIGTGLTNMGVVGTNISYRNFSLQVLD